MCAACATFAFLGDLQWCRTFTDCKGATLVASPSKPTWAVYTKITPTFTQTVSLTMTTSKELTPERDVGLIIRNTGTRRRCLEPRWRSSTLMVDWPRFAPSDQDLHLHGIPCCLPQRPGRSSLPSYSVVAADSYYFLRSPMLLALLLLYCEM